MRTSCSTGATAPVTLDWWLKATTLVRSESCSESGSIRPSSVTENQRSVAPVRRHSSCQGTRFAWCSSSVTTTSSPGPSANRSDAGSSPSRIEALDSPYATRLIPSVAFLVNTISFGPAPTNVAIRSRADS